MFRSARLPISVVLAALFGLMAARSAQAVDPEIRDLALGLKADAMPKEGYFSFACGSNGGPPLRKLTAWTDFPRCPTDQNGLHEVYVEFSSNGAAAAELYKETFGETLWIEKYSGTRVAGYAVILSVLFDDAGTAKGIRAVTDSRAGLEERGKAYTMRGRVLPHYGREGWDCVDRPPSNGESPVGSVYINQRCEKIYHGDRRVVVETHFFRKAGQTGTNAQGQFEPGQFESNTRWEVWDLSVPVG